MEAQILKRGDLWHADLGEPRGSGPAFEHPILIVQDDNFNASSIRTVLVVVLTTNLRLANAPGNVYVTPEKTGLAEDSVIVVSQMVALDRRFLLEYISPLAPDALAQVDYGLKVILKLM